VKLAPMLLALALSLALAATATSALAGDKEAKDLLKQAHEHWSDPEPTKALELADQALKANPTDATLKAQIDLFIGSLHQAKTGDFDKALEKYDAIIRSLVNTQDVGLRQIKAQAMVRKGTILYTERDDAEAALRLYQSAHQAFQLSTTVDTASQLAFRLGRNPSRPDNEKKTFMDFALKSAQEAVQLAPREQKNNPDAQAKNIAKCKLQLAIVLTALGQTEEAQKVWGEVDQAHLTDSTLYQRSILHALRGEADQATDCMKRSLAARPAGKEGAQARNQLRKMIRTEPDLATVRAREDWKDLVTDEPLR
jgi:tetratricopeptide (TPR) repeat protein